MWVGKREHANMNKNQNQHTRTRTRARKRNKKNNKNKNNKNKRRRTSKERDHTHSKTPDTQPNSTDTPCFRCRKIMIVISSFMTIFQKLNLAKRKTVFQNFVKIEIKMKSLS